jgi:hypothetical protein
MSDGIINFTWHLFHNPQAEANNALLNIYSAFKGSAKTQPIFLMSSSVHNLPSLLVWGCAIKVKPSLRTP